MKLLTGLTSFLILLVLATNTEADTFLRTYDVEGEYECFIEAIELPDGRFAVTRFPWLYGGLMFFAANGDSTAHVEEVYSEAFCLTEDSLLVFATGIDPWYLTWTDLHGNILNQVEITGVSPWNYADDIIQTSDGGFFLCGYNLAVKVSNTGEYEWHLNEGLQFYAATELENGTFIAAGQSQNACGFSDYMVNISSDGDMLWEWWGPDTPINGRGIRAVCSTVDGFVAASGSSWVRMFSAGGDVLWSYSPLNDILYKGITTSGSDVIACGSIAYELPSVVIRLDSSGDLLWEREYQYCWLSSISTTMDSGFILAGLYDMYSSPNSEASLLVKTDADGWWGGVGVEEGDPSLLITDLTIAPNPVSSSLSISYSLPETEAVELSVYDLSGRLVTNLSSGNTSSGAHSIIWNPSPGLSDGCYLIVLDACGQRAVRRAVLLR